MVAMREVLCAPLKCIWVPTAAPCMRCLQGGGGGGGVPPHPAQLRTRPDRVVRLLTLAYAVKSEVTAAIGTFAVAWVRV